MTSIKAVLVSTHETQVPSSVITEEKINTSEQLNRANIEALGTSVRLVDHDDQTGLDLFCYTKCNSGDSDLLKKCRGVVFDGDNIVMKAFPYTSDFNHTETDRLDELIGGNTFARCTFYDAHEVSLIRMFFFGGRWFVCTHRKLDAFRSKWGSSESFGTLFNKSLASYFSDTESQDLDIVLQKFQTKLNEDRQYMFLVCNSVDNRIVCDAPEKPTLYHAGTFIDGELNLSDDIGVPHSKQLMFMNIDEMLNHIDTADIKKITGVMCFAPDGKQYKIVHKDYQDLFNARGNEPSIKFRYLQVRMNRRDVDMLHYLYPNKIPIFDEYEKNIFEIAREICRNYVQRYIKKQHVTVPREEFQVMKECHEWHHQDREANLISLKRVIIIFNKQPPTNINHMIRRYCSEQDRKMENQDNMNRERANSIRSNTSVFGSPAILPIGTPPIVAPPFFLNVFPLLNKSN
jgi:hypothetical protein